MKIDFLFLTVSGLGMDEVGPNEKDMERIFYFPQLKETSQRWNLWKL